MSAVYEVVLQTTGLSDYILHAPRVDLFSANREGVMGCVGYSALFYAGIAIGTSIFAEKRTGKGWLMYTVRRCLATSVS